MVNHPGEPKSYCPSSSPSRCSSISTASTKIGTPDEEFSSLSLGHERGRSGTITQQTFSDFQGTLSHNTEQAPTSPLSFAQLAPSDTMVGSTAVLQSSASTPSLNSESAASSFSFEGPNKPARPLLLRSTTSYHKADVLSRTYDPSNDQRSIDELLARPRLPRSPFESRKSWLDTRKSNVKEDDRKQRSMKEFDDEIKELKDSALELKSLDGR